ncbi:hypothetical protein [Dietzia timorensis]|uniref:Uncharacterized protein n=1 Tax=Dietzia timorensis TaxID=499555 RepID=A0A173LJW1_9ACTN|nr:hypothetical protein [Dietzia timorensis]ANI91557.1 Hypothetical protein BJL86_0755 [Dietzia timorensis]
MSRALASRKALIVAAAVALVALVVALVGAYMALDARAEANEVRTARAATYEQQTDAVNLATKVMTNLMTIRQDTIAEDVDKIEADIDGDFASQFSPRRDSYESIVELNKVVAEGSVVAAGLENQTTDGDGKTQYNIVMAVDQQIQNQPGGDSDGADKDDKGDEDDKSDDAAKDSGTGDDAAAENDPTASAGDPNAHTYRVRVVVTPNDDGVLKVTGVNFIP